MLDFIPLPYKILGAVGLLIVAWLTLQAHDYTIYHKGYDAAMVDVAAATAKREKEAQADIIKNRGKHVKIREKNRAAQGYGAAVSPLVAAGIDRLYASDAGRAGRSGPSVRQTAAAAKNSHGP